MSDHDIRSLEHSALNDPVARLRWIEAIKRTSPERVALLLMVPSRTHDQWDSWYYDRTRTRTGIGNRTGTGTSTVTGIGNRTSIGTSTGTGTRTGRGG